MEFICNRVNDPNFLCLFCIVYTCIITYFVHKKGKQRSEIENQGERHWRHPSENRQGGHWKIKPKNSVRVKEKK